MKIDIGKNAEAQRTQSKGMNFGLRWQSEAATPLFQCSRTPGKRRGALLPAALQTFAALLLCAFALKPFCLSAATNDLSNALQKGLFEEEANRNLDAAITAYQSLVGAFDKDRKIAATAVFRLGEVYRKQGKTNEAAAQYERIVREFADQDTLVTLSRQNLAGLRKSSVSLGDVATLTGLGNASEEASRLAAHLKGIEQLKDNPEEQARAVLAFFPEETLKQMLLQLPKLKQQEAIVRENPTLQYNKLSEKLAEKLGYSPTANGSGFHTAYSPDGLEPERHSTNIITDAQWELSKQLSWIKERVGFTVGIQKARLQVLQAVAAKTSVHGAATSETSAPTTDSEEAEIRRIQAMIQNSPDLINAPRGGSTPLSAAAGAGWLRAVAFLLDHGADVNLSVNGQSPLCIATINGHKAMVELLLSRGADVNAKDGGGRTPLHTAAGNGFISVVETLLKFKADVNARDTERNGRNTPLHLAAGNGHSAIVKLLVAAGADVNAKDVSGGTPLMEAAAKGHRDTAAALLDAKADVNAADNNAATALHAAAEAGHLEVVTLLLERNALVNVQNDDKATPLLLAVFNQRTAVVKTLLEHKADPDLAGAPKKRRGVSWEEGNSVATPVYYSIKGRNNTDILALLLEHGADPDGTQTAGWRPLFQAIQDGNVRAVELLLAHKADPSKPDYNGIPPLLTDIRNVEIVRLLLEAGADANARDKDGWPALVQALNSGSPAILKSLLEHKADVNAAGPYGWTALHSAVGNGKREMVELLLAHKADVNARMDDGQTSLDLAKSNANRNQPQSFRVIPNRLLGPGTPGPLSYQWNTSSSGGSATNEPPSMENLLRRHGALDDLPDFTAIRVTRQGLDRPYVIFRADTNGWNRFTLLETVGGFYAIRNASYVGGKAVSAAETAPFPDLTRLIIHRPSSSPGGKERELTMNLLNASGEVDCTKDMPLEFGDVVEIPVREYALNEQPVGLTGAQAVKMAECLKIQVRLVVRGQAHDLTLQRRTGDLQKPAWLNWPLWLKDVLQRPESKSLLLSSSDLSRVKVTRNDPVTGKSREFIVDVASNPSPQGDLWLRDGDVIEVPEK
jgi:ankyrin repeat protein/tetratricopeptide (TPR) repeat protein